MPNINEFKSRLRGGGARANQFRVTMPFPGYASVGGETENMSFLCTSTTLPGMTVAEVAIPFRGRELYVAGDRTFATWTTTILNDTNFLIRNAYERWLNGINNMSDNEGLTTPADYQVDAFVDHLDRNGNTINTQLNCFDLTGLVYILTNNGIVDEKELFFYCHDTCDFGDSFYETMLEAAKDGLPKSLFINAIESIFIGLYDLAILNKFSSYILDYENTSNDFEVLNKIKSSLISKESFILRNYPHICSTRQDYEPTDVYKNGVVRKTEYFPDIDLYKFKANWFLKNKYEMRL